MRSDLLLSPRIHLCIVLLPWVWVLMAFTEGTLTSSIWKTFSNRHKLTVLILSAFLRLFPLCVLPERL